MYQVQVNRWGNSLGFRIPRGIVNHWHIQVGDSMELLPIDGGILLKKAAPVQKRYALSEILDSFAPSSTYPEVDFGKPEGDEAW
jgi:antitoxin MazE